ncbi:hypothetical protein Ddc_15994 [Ditylenchus destructor]|nr:hypothetical protein Ddc_15994 [Ditylenchus destructor]
MRGHQPPAFPRGVPHKDERNSKNLTVVIFCSLVLYFTSNVISNKKSEFVDTYTMVCGLVTVIKRLGLWQKFATLADVFINDANVLGLIRQFKTTALMLPISKVKLCCSYGKGSSIGRDGIRRDVP